MSVYKIPLGNPMVLAHQLPDGHTGKYVRAVLRRPDGTALVASPINLAHVGNGLYTNDDENMPSQQFVTSTYITYSDAAYTIVDVAYGFDLEVFFLTSVTVDNIADQVWDEKLSVHLSAGTTGKALSDIETDVGTLIGKSDPPTASETLDSRRLPCCSTTPALNHAAPCDAVDRSGDAPSTGDLPPRSPYPDESRGKDYLWPPSPSPGCP